jgi:hypothetical protein
MEEAVSNFWHVYSDGTLADIPFNTEEDKLFAWNSVAVCAEIAGVQVWVVTVNDTHLHSLVRGEESRAKRFKKVLQQRLQTEFHDDGIYLTCDAVQTRDEVLTKFMYVYRNCLDFYKKLPGEYPWGSGNIYFSEKRQFFRGRRIGDISFREQYRLFRTRERLPEDWRFDSDGRILPESFIDYEAVEDFFVSPKTFLAFQYIRKDKEAELKKEIHRRYLESRSIQDLRRIGNQICSQLYGRTLSKVSLEPRLEVASRMIRDGTAGRSASLAKALFLKPDDLQLLI